MNNEENGMPYSETIIEGIPLEWLEWEFGWGFPNYLEFKPTLPRWWQNLESQCPKCDNKYLLRDVSAKRFNALADAP